MMHQTTKQQNTAVIPDFIIITLLGDAILPHSQRSQPSPYQFDDIYK